MARRELDRSGGAFGIWWFWHAALGTLTVTAAVIVGATVVDQTFQQKAAAAEDARYVPPTVALEPYVTVVGDSYTAGSGMNSGDSTLWTAAASARANVLIRSLSVGGSGYLTRNTVAADHTNFVDRAREIRRDSAEVIFFGSRNDETSAPDQVRKAAATAFATAKKRAPDAKLIVIGPQWTDSSPPSWITGLEGAVHDAARSAGAVWVDPIAADWFPTGSGLIGADGVHPTDAGHAHLAKLIEPIIERNLPKG